MEHVCVLKICKECFYEVFEEEIHQVIVKNHLFKSGERVAIGASGGKGNLFNSSVLQIDAYIRSFIVSADSTVLAYVLSELNRRHSYGLDLFLLSIDEGITGYRDDSLETVKRNELQVSLFWSLLSISNVLKICPSRNKFKSV